MKPGGLFCSCCGENEGTLLIRKDERVKDIILLWFCCRFVFPSEWGTANGSDCSIRVKNELGPKKCAYEEPWYKMTLKEMDFFNLKGQGWEGISPMAIKSQSV